MRWKFVSLQSGGDIQIVTTASERARFMRYCNDQGIRCGLLRVEETGIVVEPRDRGLDGIDPDSRITPRREHRRRPREA